MLLRSMLLHVGCCCSQFSSSSSSVEVFERLPVQLEEDGVDIVAGHVGRWRVGFKVDRIFRKGGKERSQAFLGQIQDLALPNGIQCQKSEVSE